MPGTNTAVPKWILLLAFSQVSGFMIQQFSNQNENLATNLINAVKDNEFHDKEDFQNIVYDTAKKHLASKNANSRNSENVKDFMYKRLVKRIVPHGYEMKDVEYDHKFKTLFKPLVRIHKRKPNIDDSSDEEDRYDLISVLDDKAFEDSPLAKDDSLLKPFTIDNMDVKYLPTDNEVEYIINKGGNVIDVNSRPNEVEYIINKGRNVIDVNYRPNEVEYIINTGGNVIDVDSRPTNQFKDIEQSRHKLVNNIETKAKKFSNSIYLDDDKLNQVLGRQLEHWIPYDQESATSLNINELLRKPKTSPEKLHRVSIDKILSKNGKPEQNINGLKESIARSYRFKYLSDENKNNKKYITILNLLQQHAKKQVKTKEIKKDIKPLGWFGPVGVLNSKQLTKTYGYDEIDSSKTYDYDEINQPKNYNNLLGSLNQIETSDEDQATGSDSVQDNIQELLRPVGHIYSKHIKYDDWKRETDTKGEPFYFMKPKDFRQKNDMDIGKEIQSNKVTLLNKIAQLKANNLKNQIKERLKEKELSIAEKLRSHIKSGEEEEAALKDQQQFDYDDGPTTEKHVTWKPKYPFWNEWTYDKQIVQDDCKGKLIQSGRVCINAFA